MYEFCIMNFNDTPKSHRAFIERLQFRLHGALPGLAAWQAMMPQGRTLEIPPGQEPTESAVLVIFMEIGGELNLLLIRRSQDGRIHGGQIGFPGGRAEPSDSDYWFTALREAQEEVGIQPDFVQFMGKLTPIYIPHSNFRVHPYVSYSTIYQLFKRQQEEVDEILLIPFIKFLSKQNIREALFHTLHGPISAPCFEIENIRIWGATAMILNELIYLSKDILAEKSL